MRVFVIGDMEGVSGIVKWEQVTSGETLYEEGRKLYTEEINAAVRGAKAAGATEIVVMDCHGAGRGHDFNSLLPDLLDPDCEWVVQNEWTEYTELLEQGCDAALLVAMHSKSGAERGVMSHTISGRDYRDLRFNGVSVGETGINAALCGTWGCPVVLVTAASRGIGAACAQTLAARGYSVALLARSDAVLALAEELGGVGVVGSVTEGRDLQALVDRALAAYGRIDAVVVNTGHPPTEIHAARSG